MLRSPETPNRLRNGLLVVLALTLALAPAPALAQEESEGDLEPWRVWMLKGVDVTLSRPLGLVRLIVGSAFFTATAVPVTTVHTLPRLLGDAFRGKFEPDFWYLDEAAQRAVTDPFDHVFTRELGSFSL